MKKILSLCLATVLCLSLLAVASAAKYNPFDDQFKNEARQLRQAGIAKNIFVVFDENKQQIKSGISVIYRDETGQNKEMVADVEGRILVSLTKPGYIQVLKLKVDDAEYEVLGKEAFEDFDYEDIVEGEVDYNVIQFKTNSKIAYIYDAE